MPNELIIGLMSGTSVDGIDAALVEFSSVNQLKVIETAFTSFDSALRNRINKLALTGAQITQSNDTPLHQELAALYAKASLDLVDKAGVRKSQISAIANHGQTICHAPNANPAYSIQLGDGQLIADLSGITTLTQFRQADMAAGGQGAPLMPAFHKALFGIDIRREKTVKTTETIVLNLGGIANLTTLSEPVIGFDTGPANTLMDQWIHQHKNQAYDKNGDWASRGEVMPLLLQTLLEDPYFSLTYPKSTGPDYFNLDWLRRHMGKTNTYSPADVQATLLLLTAKTVALGISQLDQPSVGNEIFVCGGGAQNTALMTAIANELPQAPIKKTDALGVPSNWVEAVGFAWLGYCHLHNITSNLPSVTGASKAVVLGERFNPQGAI